MGKILDSLKRREVGRATHEEQDHPREERPVPLANGRSIDAILDDAEVPFIEVPDATRASPGSSVLITPAPPARPAHVEARVEASAASFAPAPARNLCASASFGPDLRVAFQGDNRLTRQFTTVAEALVQQIESVRCRSLLFVPLEELEEADRGIGLLALCIAARGLRCLLVDTAGEDSQIPTLFNMAAAPGWTDLLAGASAAQVIQSCGLPNLHVVGGGNRLVMPPAPERLSRIAQILRKLRSSYDLVALRTACWTFQQPLPLSAYAADAVCLLALQGPAGEQLANRAAEALQASQIAVLGSVLLEQ